MVANDKINFKTGCRAPIAQLFAGYIVAETFQFMHKVGLECLTKFRCTGPELPSLQDSHCTYVKKVIFRRSQWVPFL